MFASSLVIVASWLALGQAKDAQAEKAQKPAASKEAPKAVEDFRLDFKEYVIRLQGRPKEKLTLREEPVLHWENPARNGEDGAVFVWMLDGRPEVIGTVFTYRIGNNIRRKHEFHTLASGPLTADYQGNRVWAPKSEGVTFRPIPDAPEPAGSARLRLTQMKALAREFSSRMEDREGKKFELRLVPQQLIRYEPKNQPATDGAIFSFAVGTDPESLLLIEARKDKGRSTWQYAFARFHYNDLWASHKGKEVWHVASLADIETLDIGTAKYQDSVYTTFHTKTTPIGE